MEVACLVLVACAADGTSGDVGSSTDSTQTSDHTTESTVANETSSGTSAASDSGSCETIFEWGDFVQVSERRFGLVSIVDIDSDGEVDIYGGVGVAAVQHDSEFQITSIADAPDTNNSRVGQFGGTSQLDFVFPLEGENEIWVYLDGFDAVPVVTPSNGANNYDARDFDEDGFDDLSLLVDLGQVVEIRASAGDGAFVLVDQFDFSMAAMSAFYMHPPNVDLAVVSTMQVELFEGDGSVEFAPFEVIDLASIYTLDAIPIPDHPLAADEFLVLSFFDNGFESRSKMAYLSMDSDGWHDETLELTPSEALILPDGADVDADGDNDAIVAVRTAQGIPRLIIACGRGAELIECGGIDVFGEAESVAFRVVNEALHVVYSTRDAGVWTAELSVSSTCP
jgi:hypothetical protein